MSEVLPDLRQLRAFVAVADEGSFTLAAKRLFLTQSAISHSMRALEDSLDCQLLSRLGKKTVITEEGAVLLRRCRIILSELDQVGRELDGLKRWGQSRIRIGAPHSLCQFVLPAVLREFRDCFPRCEPLIETGDTEGLLRRLDDHELDVVLGLQLHPPREKGVRPLFHDRMAFIVPPVHPWAEAGLPDEADFDKVQFISYAQARGTYRLVEEYFAELGVRPKPPLVLGDMESIKEMSKIGIGVGIVADWVVKREVEDGTLVALPAGDRPIEREWAVFWNDERPLSLVEETFAGIAGMVGTDLSGR